MQTSKADNILHHSEGGGPYPLMETLFNDPRNLSILHPSHQVGVRGFGTPKFQKNRLLPPSFQSHQMKYDL